MKLRSARTLIPVVVCVAAVGALLIGGLTRSVVYFRTVSEAVEAREADGTSRVRVAGAVVPGSVHTDGDGVNFELTDGLETVQVHHRGDPPELFEDGAPVVSEGAWLGSAFESDRLMIKHGSEYAPPDVDRAEPAVPSPTETYDPGSGSAYGGGR